MDKSNKKLGSEIEVIKGEFTDTQNHVQKVHDELVTELCIVKLLKVRTKQLQRNYTSSAV